MRRVPGAADGEPQAAAVERNEAELREYEAEAVVGHCTYFLEHASELWQRERSVSGAWKQNSVA
jgi:hypothetical protein